MPRLTPPTLSSENSLRLAAFIACEYWCCVISKEAVLCVLVSLARLPSMTALWDYENWLLSTYNTELGIPVGLERLTHEHWVRHVKSDLPNSDWTWDQYVQHVQAGDGDDWFFEPRPEDPAP